MIKDSGDLNALTKAASSLICLKDEMNKRFYNKVILRELIPADQSILYDLDEQILHSLQSFASANTSIYTNSFSTELLGTRVWIHEGDSSPLWLESKKHDTSYQPFYATWLTSAYLLVKVALSLGYTEIIDIGSGDGRLDYCAAMLGVKSFGIEIDPTLVSLQLKISQSTKTKYEIFEADATRFNYKSLLLKRPIFFISGLPEMGEMLANSVIDHVRKINTLNECGFCFMGSHSMRWLSRDHTLWGWGSVLSSHDLKWRFTITLPTQWTHDQPFDTPYVFASL